MNECSNIEKNVLSICSLNVHGGLECKLENMDFVNEFVSKDIVFYSETWTNKNSILNLDGFSKPICKHRRRCKKAKRDSGGLCIFLKNNIAKGVHIIPWDEFEDGLVLKLDKDFFRFDDNIFLLCVYIRQHNSSINSINTTK